MSKEYKTLGNAVRSVLEGVTTDATTSRNVGHVKSGRNEYSSDDGGHRAASARIDAQEKEAENEMRKSEKEKNAEIKKRNQEAEKRNKEQLNMGEEKIESSSATIYVKQHPTKSGSYVIHDIDDPEKELEGHLKKGDTEDHETVHGFESLGHKVVKMNMEEKEPEGTILRKKIPNVARQDSANATSSNSTLSKTASIRNQIIGEKSMFTKGLGLSASLIEAAKKVMDEKNKIGNTKTPVDVNPKLDVKIKEEKMVGPCKKCGKAKCMCEGNPFAYAASKTAKGETFTVGGKEFTKEELEELFSERELESLAAIDEAPQGADTDIGASADKDTTRAFVSDETDDSLTKRNKKEHPGRQNEIQNIIKDVSGKIFPGKR
jgi:hypothetical protein